MVFRRFLQAYFVHQHWFRHEKAWTGLGWKVPVTRPAGEDSIQSRLLSEELWPQVLAEQT